MRRPGDPGLSLSDGAGGLSGLGQAFRVQGRLSELIVGMGQGCVLKIC